MIGDMTDSRSVRTDKHPFLNMIRNIQINLIFISKLQPLAIYKTINPNNIDILLKRESNGNKGIVRWWRRYGEGNRK